MCLTFSNELQLLGARVSLPAVIGTCLAGQCGCKMGQKLSLDGVSSNNEQKEPALVRLTEINGKV